MEVPLMVLVAVVLPIHAPKMLLPGAKTLQHVPQLEKYERTSPVGLVPWSRAAVVITKVALAGETLQAFWFSLPAATTKGIPAVTTLLQAVLRAAENPPPRDMFPVHRPPRLAQLPAT